MASRSDILNVLETRYDHLSAKVVFAEVLENTRLEEKAKYEPAEVVKIANSLIRVGSRVEKVVDGIRALDAKPAKAAPAKKEAPVATEKEAAPEEKKPKKAAAKKTKKSAAKKS